MVLLQSYSALLGINDALNSSHSELDVEVGNTLVKDATFQLRLDFLVPYRFRVEMQVVFESSGNDHAARKLITKFGGNSKPPFVVESPFEVVQPRSFSVKF